MITLANVLVATDFGAASDAALGYGRELARTFGAKLHVLHVVENPTLCLGPEAATVDFSRLLNDLKTDARRTLETLVTPEDLQQLGAVPVIRIGNGPALQIVQYAKQAGIDIIVMGTHGTGFMTHLLMGSVAEKVVRIAPCPVLTVKHPEHEFVIPDALQVLERAAQ